MIDLHIHSTASDGTLTPEQIVQVALAKGLSAIAIADHDTVGGVRPAIAAARGTGLEVFPAVEVSAQVGEHELHILGYCIDLASEELQATLLRAQVARQERVREMVRRLQALGLPITDEDVAAHARGTAPGRPHVAAAMVSRGIVRQSQDAFHRYLRRGRPGYVERWKLMPADAIGLIKRAGGVAVFAHPGLSGCDDRVPSFAEFGLEGLEAYHVDHSPSQTMRYKRLAKALGMLVTGGTDSHGPTGPTPVEIGQVQVPDECAESLRQWQSRHG